MVNKLPPLAGPVDASGEPVVVGYRAPITSAPYCLDCVRKHHPWSDTHDPPPVYDTHETCINCGKSLRAAAAVPSSLAQEPLQAIALKIRKFRAQEIEMKRCTGYQADQLMLIADEIEALALPSSPVADSPTLRRLIEEWRQHSADTRSQLSKPFRNALNICADELDTALSAPSPSAGANKEKS